MRIVTPPIVINQEEPFAQDVLDRKEFGQSLINLVAQSEDELVISLDGQWGEGKSTFVKMWQGMLNQENIPNIYIDAFANDYIDDAFIAVASAITNYIEEKNPKDENAKVEEFREKTKKVGVQLLSWTAKATIKAATLGIIKDNELDALKAIQDTLAEDLSTFVGDLVEERLTSYKENLEELAQFKEILSNTPKLLSPKSDKPLVIIIDELDRCKPTYALDLIEKTKHLFSVKNVVFVLVMHKKQLEESVRCIYGAKVDAYTYLQKFINVETTLPKNNSQWDISDIDKYNRNLFELHGLDKIASNELLLSFGVLAKHFKLSLRELERAYTNATIFYISSNSNSFKIDQIIAFLAITKIVKPEIYKELLNKKTSFYHICQNLNLTEEEPEERNMRYLLNIVNHLKYCLISNSELQDLDPYDEVRCLKGTYYNINIEREDYIPYHINKMSLFKIS